MNCKKKSIMWTLFKIVNLFWLLASTSMWPTALLNPGPVIMPVDILLVICLGFLPIKIKFGAKTGLILLAILANTLWISYVDGPMIGIIIMEMYLPALFLTFIPANYLKDLLNFCVKWIAILLIPALCLYWITLFVDLPSLGTFSHPNYEVPYKNYIFFIKTTYDYGTLVRFNAFLLEPGHLALMCTFLMMACKFRFKQNKWLWVLLVSVIFSFSLAGYLLLIIGYLLLNINSMVKVTLLAIGLSVVVYLAIDYGRGENAVNQLIIERLEKDDSRGIKGNNRVSNATEYVYDSTVRKGRFWTGVKDRVNMSLVEGAGYKLYVINYGVVGVILAFFLYLSLIPSGPDYRYTISFLIVLMLCFMQRSYPSWYSWLFPFITGIYIAKAEKETENYISN